MFGERRRMLYLVQAPGLDVETAKVMVGTVMVSVSVTIEHVRQRNVGRRNVVIVHGWMNDSVRYARIALSFYAFPDGFESSLRRSWTGKNAEKNVSRDVSIRISIVDCW